MTMIKAIETVYKGYRFRSRLEARWAVFFDALGIKWEYEKEGYDLGKAGRYLPDFWLPDYKYWIEIKAENPSQGEWDKAYELSSKSGRPVHICVGLPDIRGRVDSFYYEESNSGGGLTMEDWVYWCACSKCDKPDIAFGTTSQAVFIDGYAYEEQPICCDADDQEMMMDHPSLMRAYVIARSARFEHGERGM
jgi:hypothetical protein